VGDIKNTYSIAYGNVFFSDAGVFYRHIKSGKWDHSCASLLVKPGKWSVSHKLIRFMLL
jgi:hypothetical protein